MCEVSVESRSIKVRLRCLYPVLWGVAGLVFFFAGGCVFDRSGRPILGDDATTPPADVSVAVDAGLPSDGGPSADAVASDGGVPICGNGQIETGETCDLDALGGATCQTLDFGSGVLLCSADCTLDFGGCIPASPWSCRQPISIDNTANGAPLVDYQLFFDVPHLVGMAADFSDLRFGNIDLSQQFDYWIEARTQRGVGAGLGQDSPDRGIDGYRSLSALLQFRGERRR